MSIPLAKCDLYTLFDRNMIDDSFFDMLERNSLSNLRKVNKEK